jgi:light-regulated signal transduction histidine kinase (bacteriophytochrome)
MQGARELLAPAIVDVDDEFRDFAYIVSHDLAGPVRSIVGFSQILAEQADKLDNEEDRLHLDLVIESGERLNEMIQGLLAFSRLNTVSRPVEMVDLEMILAKCHMALQMRLDNSKGQLTYPKMPEVRGDPSRLYTLFYALLDNALKFRRDGVPPDIRVYFEESANQWDFCIADNGIGIDPMFYDDVFRPLRKLHTDEAYSGVGMGLTLARKIVIQHGGNIELEPSDSGGLAVYFSLSKTPPVVI